MKRTIKVFVIALTMVASGATVFAQQSNLPRTSQQQRISREQLAEVEARHIAGELAFSDAVAEKFVTAYCNCQKEIWALGPRQRSGKQDSSEQENRERIKQRFAMSEKILSIRQKYYKEYSKFLSQAQIEKVYEHERKLMNRHAKRNLKRSEVKQRKS